jgi:EAL domain-containing protein (putative c-di-GMP-specific phosphodiesterase class I)
LAARIEAAMEEPLECQGYKLSVTLSIGIATNEGYDADADYAFNRADIALSKAKQIRGSYVFYTSSMQSGTIDRLTMESDLRAALLRDEFELHYQPQVNIDTGEIIGIEALVRWNHPDKGLIPPGEFIPLAEENGMIVAIGEKVMRMACRQAAEWRKAGLPDVPIAVNISLRQFLQPNLIERIEAILEETGLPPEQLEVEVTESATSDVEHAENVLGQLKRLGVNICIDDFGTGYSSLGFLRKFPISRLKIDRSFVRDIMSDRSDAQIVETIIAMSRHLNIKVIAEGVETEDQLQFLRDQRCYEAQGFLLAKPMPASHYPDWYRMQRLA